MYDTKRDTIDAMSGMPDVLRHLALDRSAQSRTPPAPPGEWGLIEIVCHLRDAEERAIERTRLMRDHDNPEIAPYDPAKWAVERDYASQDLAAVLTSFQFFRDMHVSELRAIHGPIGTEGGGTLIQTVDSFSGHALHVASHDESVFADCPSRHTVVTRAA